MEPRPLLELNVQQAIASILQKPRWWIKSQDPEIRKKWMSEVEQQLLFASFAQSLVNWRHGQFPVDYLDDLLAEPDEALRYEDLREWLSGIVTEFYMGDESEEEYSDMEDFEEEVERQKTEDTHESGSVGDDEDSNDLSEEEKKKMRALKQKVAARESYPTVKWTLNQLLLHEKLSQVCVEEWGNAATREAFASAHHLKDPELVPRAVAFVLAVRRGVSVEEALPLPPGSDLLSADRLLKLKLHCEKIHRELDAVQSYMMKVLVLIAEREGLNADTDPAEVVLCPAGIDGVWISDNLITEEVAKKFTNEVAVLESVPDDEKDWHPHSKKQVLDLVHPSLFCCVFGETKKASNALDPSTLSSPSEQMHRLMFNGSEIVEQPSGCNTDYQWIPTDFFITDGGESGQDCDIAARALSYINNLHPEQHSELYNSIETIFGRFVPLFERMLTDRAEGMLPSTFDVDMMSHDSWRIPVLPRRPRVPDVVELSKETNPISLRGKVVQAIVKIAEIILTPENPEYKGGSWHVEGTPAEKIIGTGIYYFASDNIKDSRLAYRAEVEEPPYQQSDDDGVAEIYGLFNGELLVQVLGSVETSASRCVAFPNWLQHQVQPFELEDPTKPGVRKILAFFLIDPENSIFSTSVIPPQQQEWITPTLESMLQRLHLVDSVEQNIQSMLPRGMSLTAAKQHRLLLMEERAAVQEDDEDTFGNSRYFSLCEH
ncbi:DUF4246 domain-containing protein [Phytophthora cinnamomi]|uniref:DUF4246 domain-containing protein n=1 Tax=Phytophthora cinnamomi TaxID=4785 RepID=UPI003559CFC3|nr:DUF4246 domain-containing protein [Phytophthora cinnamomi]